MGLTIFLGARLGKYLDDNHSSAEKNWYTMGFTIFAVAISLYAVLRQVNKLNDESDKD